MLYWKNILQIVLIAVNVLYITSLVMTMYFYPAGPIYDLETDEITGYN